MQYIDTVIFLGASSDLQQATSIATHMVKDWGMSEKLGLRTISENAKNFHPEQLGPATNEVVSTQHKNSILQLLKPISSSRWTTKSEEF